MHAFFSLGLFFFTMLLLLLGFPIAFTLAGASVLWAGVAFCFNAISFDIFGAIPSRIFGGIMNNGLLLSVPLFVFMGTVLAKAKIAEELLENMGRIFSRMPGGLGVSVFIVGALLAASTGIVGATVVTMGLMSLPTMLRQGYKPSITSGIICASGTLGQIIPPSVILILLGNQISNAYVEAQRYNGNWSPDPVTVGDIFAGAIIPGFLLVGLYIVYQVAYALILPKRCPTANQRQQISLGKNIEYLFAPLALIVIVLGSIVWGVATPTEASAIGSMGALFLATYKLSSKKRDKHIIVATVGAILLLFLLKRGVDLRLGWTGTSLSHDIFTSVAWALFVGIVATFFYTLYFCKKKNILNAILQETTYTTTKIFTIFIGATFFSLVFVMLGGDTVIEELLLSIKGGVTTQIFLVMIFIFILGMFLDFIEIILIVVPIFAPVLFRQGINPVWLSVIIAVNLQTSFLTPPFGFTLFYLRGVAPSSLRTIEIYKGVIPFIVIQIVMLVLLGFLPSLATWLPYKMFGSSF